MSSQPAVVLRKTYESLCEGFKEAAEALEAEFKLLKEDNAFIQSKKASIFVLSWMREHFLFQERFKKLIKSGVMPSNSGWFTGAIALSLEKYLSANGKPDAVKSEVALKRQRGALRPDISIWANENRLVAAIECKTNLGFNRSNWRNQYKERTDKMQRLHHGCLSYLCVLTKENLGKKLWPEFEKSELAGSRWFCLADIWPTKLGEAPQKHILYPIEPLFVQVRKALTEVGNE